MIFKIRGLDQHKNVSMLNTFCCSCCGSFRSSCIWYMFPFTCLHFEAFREWNLFKMTRNVPLFFSMFSSADDLKEVASYLLLINGRNSSSVFVNMFYFFYLLNLIWFVMVCGLACQVLEHPWTILPIAILVF